MLELQRKALQIRIEAAVGGAYEMPDGRAFWIDAPVAVEISRRAVAALETLIPEPAPAREDA